MAIGWAFFGARALHEKWAPGAAITVVIVGSLLAFSKSFNVEARFRLPRNSAEEKLVQQLSFLNGAGAIGMLVSVVWLLIGSSGDFIVSFIAPLVIFMISMVLQGASAVFYSPFLLKDGG